MSLTWEPQIPRTGALNMLGARIMKMYPRPKEIYIKPRLYAQLFQDMRAIQRIQPAGLSDDQPCLLLMGVRVIAKN